MARHKPELLDHKYDGIQEYDNPTPGWWHALFIGSVFFSIVYIVFWHFSPLASTPYTRLEVAQTRANERLFGALGDLENDPETIAMLLGDEKWVGVGAAIYTKNCAQCHGSDGGGINGPNLTDDAYLHVGGVGDLFSVITDGVVSKGMPAWNNRLSDNQRVVVSAYVAHLRGNLQGGKGAEGEVIPGWELPAVSESE